MTTDNRGEEVYGGSDLMVVRGGFAALPSLPFRTPSGVAVEQARRYDAADSVASRDVRLSAQLRCRPGPGRRRIVALRRPGAVVAHRRRDRRRDRRARSLPGRSREAIVRASTFEIYGESEAPPSRAMVYFRGIDERIGPLTKYALAEPYDDT